MKLPTPKFSLISKNFIYKNSLKINKNSIKLLFLQNYIVWNLRTTEKIRHFKAERSEIWGSYQWSFDSAYMARLNEISAEECVISVYKLPEMSLLENEEGQKTSIKVQGIQRISWVENSRTLVCVSHGSNRSSIPTKVCLLDVNIQNKH